jgi:uncharacterized protein YbaR (Trm112 family)
MSAESPKQALPSAAELQSEPPPPGTWIDRHVVGFDEGAQGLVVLIQDLPGNSGVQRHIGKLIAFYAGRFGIPVCFLEGATGPADFWLFETMPVPLRDAFSDYLLERCYLTGAELFSIQCPAINCELYGADAPALYSIQAHAAGFLQGAERSLGRKAIVARDTFMAHIDRAPRDFAAVAHAVDHLMKSQLGAANAEDIRNVISLAHVYLGSASDVTDEPTSYQGIAPHALQDSLRWLTTAWKVEDYLAKQEQLQDLAELHRFLVLAPSMFSLQLMDGMQELVHTVGEAAVINRVAAKAATVSRAWGLGEEWLSTVSDLTRSWTLPHTYYGFALRRSKQMAENVATFMAERFRADRAMLVSGGYHSEQIARYLWEQHHIKSFVITPNVSRLSDGMLYGIRILEDRWSFWRALSYLTPSLLLQYGPFGYIRKLARLGLTYAKLQIVRRLSQSSGNTHARKLALTRALQTTSHGTVLAVEAIDLGGMVPKPSHIRSIWTDQYTYNVGEIQIPGVHWPWRELRPDSMATALCCDRSYLPLRTGSVGEVIWVPRLLTIREVELVRTASELVRVLEPNGLLRVWIPSRDLGDRMVGAFAASSSCDADISDDWVVVRKSSLEIPPPQAPTVDYLNEPIIRVCMVPRDSAELGKALSRFLSSYGFSNFVHFAGIHGLHADLANMSLGLRRPPPDEVQSFAIRELDDALRVANLVILVADRVLLELVGGSAGLKRVLDSLGRDSAVFVIIEELGDTTGLGVGEFRCSDICETARGGTPGFVETLRTSLESVRIVGFAPRLPQMLLPILACPECDSRPPLAVQVGFKPPKHSEGLLACKACHSGFGIHNGMPVTTGLTIITGSLDYTGQSIL